MSNIFYSYNDYIRDFGALCDTLKSMPYHLHHDVIVGINRGGCLPAVQLSHKLKIPCTMIDWSTRDGSNLNTHIIGQLFKNFELDGKRVLLVDDILDSGKSINTLLNKLGTTTNLTNIDLAVLVENVDVSVSVDVYSGQQISRKEKPEYFDFFWEV